VEFATEMDRVAAIVRLLTSVQLLDAIHSRDNASTLQLLVTRAISARTLLVIPPMVNANLSILFATITAYAQGIHACHLQDALINQSLVTITAHARQTLAIE